jgi:hypothetical protein
MNDNDNDNDNALMMGTPADLKSSFPVFHFYLVISPHPFHNNFISSLTKSVSHMHSRFLELTAHREK